jgi:hypothetical protein
VAEKDDGWRRGGMRRAGGLLSGVLSPAARRRGFAEVRLLGAWAGIVGPELAARCRPVRLAHPDGRFQPGVLHLHASGTAALLLQHQTPQILERINAYFGHLAVARLRILQAPLPPPRLPEPPEPELDPVSAERVERSVEGVGEPELRAALLALGRALALAERRKGPFSKG